MWLINTNTLRLESFVDERQTKYAILSHRWTEEEVTFQKFSSGNPKVIRAIRKLRGFWKIERCCRRALKDGLQYVWVDTCCIDKSSSAELQEAINSMFKYYHKAEVCYAYLSDVTVHDSDSFERSQWFTRGWTLQELIAPQVMMFFDACWRLLGSREDLTGLIQSACGTPASAFEIDWNSVERPCIATIMSWASGRFTTRVEDRAYSLLGLFDINMPLLYGEGEKAFQRLQEEIFMRTEDQTIFAWEGVPTIKISPFLFASSPDQFPKQHFFFPLSSNLERRKPHTLTNEGILFEASLVLVRPRTYLMPLSNGGYRDACIVLKKLDGDDRYARIPGWWLDKSLGDLVSFNTILKADKWRVKRRLITVVRKLRRQELSMIHVEEPLAFRNFEEPASTYDLYPYVGNGWYSYCGDTSSDLRRRQLTATLLPEETRREFKPTFSSTIESGQYSLGPVAFMSIRSNAIRYGLLGFDSNFLPVCILSTGFLVSKTFSQERLKVLFGGENHGAHFPLDGFAGFQGTAPHYDDSSQTGTLKVASIRGGSYRELSSDMFVFTANESLAYLEWIPYELELSACILVTSKLTTLDPQETNGRSGAIDSIFEDTYHVSLDIYRQHLRLPWRVVLVVHDTKVFQCNRCCPHTGPYQDNRLRRRRRCYRDEYPCSCNRCYRDVNVHSL